MTLLSVVLPVHRVQGYLAECLDSLLGPAGADLEIVAVDDGSPDGSGAILATYAGRDPRVRVLTLPANVGLGRARNAGLDAALGDYVWFVDSDDRVAPGALGAIARRLRDADPDVLFVGFDRVHWDGRVEPGSGRDVLAAAPEGFTAEAYPEILDVLHVAWNKVVRRELLVKREIRFAPGWYEDVSFTYPLLAVAERISVLPRVCVHYRQRRTGRSPGPWTIATSRSSTSGPTRWPRCPSTPARTCGGGWSAGWSGTAWSCWPTPSGCRAGRGDDSSPGSTTRWCGRGATRGPAVARVSGTGSWRAATGRPIGRTT